MAGIYIHIPFCKQACYYCDFHFSTSLKKKDDLLSCLIKELEIRRAELENKQVESVYFGGGTPSLLTSIEIIALLDTIGSNYMLIDTPEITLEANPDDLDYVKLVDLKNTGINRLSIGIQSFYNDDLKAMNRAHNAHEAHKCLNEASKHFSNITIDLIYGIPGMSVDKWRRNLEQTFNYEVSHISSYALTVEPKTALANFIEKGKYPPVDDELALKHFQELVALTNEKGYIHYEISNFGKEGFFSKHNSNYWKGIPYLGIGPSAHSYNGDQRSWNINNNSKYIEAINNDQLPQQNEVLSINDRFNELLLIGLRTIWGVDLKAIEIQFGLDFVNHLKFSAEALIEQEMIQINKGILTLTSKGKFLADGIASQLFMI